MTASLEEELVALGLPEIRKCVGASGHTPRPLVVRQVSLYTNGPRVSLCAVCADNYAMLWRLLEHHHGLLPWHISRRFGNSILTLGVKAWAESQLAASEHLRGA